MWPAREKEYRDTQRTGEPQAVDAEEDVQSVEVSVLAFRPSWAVFAFCQELVEQRKCRPYENLATPQTHDSGVVL